MNRSCLIFGGRGRRLPVEREQIGMIEDEIGIESRMSIDFLLEGSGIEKTGEERAKDSEWWEGP